MPRRRSNLLLHEVDAGDVFELLERDAIILNPGAGGLRRFGKSLIS